MPSKLIAPASLTGGDVETVPAASACRLQNGWKPGAGANRTSTGNTGHPLPTEGGVGKGHCSIRSSGIL